MPRNCANGTEVIEGGHDDIRLVYRGKFADRGMSYIFTQCVWRLFLEKGEDYTEYPILEEKARVMGYRDGPVASEETHGYLKSGADIIFEKLPKGVEDDDDWDFDGAIDGESAQDVDIKRKLQDLQD